MLKKLLACTLAALLVVGAPLSMGAAPSRVQLASADLETKVIIQLAQKPVLIYEAQLKEKGNYSIQSTTTYANTLKQGLKTFLSTAKSRGINLKTDAQFTHTFYGFSASVPFSQIAELEKVPGVKRVFPDMPIYLPKIDYTVPQTGAPTLWEMPGGYTGEGTVVAVIDTGIDYSHPYLWVDPADPATCRVIDGWNFTDDRTPDNPMDGHGHGTHVAGIVAADGTAFGDTEFKGMAPDAQLYALKVLSDAGRGYSSWVIAGMEWAVNPPGDLPRADVINMSLGASMVTDPNYPTCLAANAAAEAGVIVAASAGNDGQDIPTASAPSLGPKVISVASYGYIQLAYIEFAGQEVWDVAPVADGPAPDGLPHGVVYAGLGGEDDFEGLDLTGKIALMQRGTYAFTEKAENAQAAGAIAALIFNNTTGVQGMSGTFPIPTFALSLETGLEIVGLLEDDSGLELAMKQLPAQDLLSSFSSAGPANNYALKPDITAPGDAVLSLYPGGFATMGGTSMACPHVAGAAALLKQKYGDLLSVEEYKALLMNTAALLNNIYDVKYPVTSIGAGVMDLAATAYARGLALPASVSLRIDGPDNTIKVRNISDEDITYTITFSSETLEAEFQAELTVAAGATEEFDVVFVLDGLADGDHEGYLTLTPDSEAVEGYVDRLQIPVYHYVGEHESFYLRDFVIPEVLRLGATFDISFSLGRDVDYMELDIEDLAGNFYGGWELGEDISAGDYTLEGFDPEGLYPGEYVFELYAEIGEDDFNLTSQVVTVKTGVHRLAGANRYNTAVAVSQKGWDTASTVILARGDSFADSLAGVGLSAKLDAPILLTNSKTLSPAALDEIERLEATTVIILGGEGAVSDAVENALEDKGLTVERISGANRYETAALIAARVIEGAGDISTAIIVSGEKYADALAVAPLAVGGPVLMVKADSLPSATADFLAAHNTESTLVIGGEAVVSETVFDLLPEPTRLAGTNRYDTAVQLALATGIDPAEIFLASGENFADALCLGALAAKRGGCLLLTRGTVLSPATAEYLADNAGFVCVVTAAGGKGTIAPEVLRAIDSLFYPTE